MPSHYRRDHNLRFDRLTRLWFLSLPWHVSAPPQWATCDWTVSSVNSLPYLAQCPRLTLWHTLNWIKLKHRDYAESWDVWKNKRREEVCGHIIGAMHMQTHRFSNRCLWDVRELFQTTSDCVHTLLIFAPTASQNVDTPLFIPIRNTLIITGQITSTSFEVSLDLGFICYKLS